VLKPAIPAEEGPTGMLTQEDDVEIHALAARGWSVSAISRHTGHDRKTVRKYLAGAGRRRECEPASRGTASGTLVTAA